MSIEQTATKPPISSGLGSKNAFFYALRRKVFKHLRDNNLPAVDNGGMALKAATSYALWALSYGAYLYVGYAYQWHALWLLGPMIFSMLLIVLAVMHDGSHGSFNRSKRVSKWAAYSLGFAGGSSILWLQLHVRDHHTNTNVNGYDQDFESGGLLRLHPAQEKAKGHRFQHLYAWALYMGFALRWIIYDDVYDLITNRCNFSAKKQRSLGVEIFVVKVWHAICFLVVPGLVMGWPVALTFYVIHWMVLSLVLVLIFATAHLSGSQVMPMHKGQYNDFAIHQLATTANYATGNRFLTWFTGGLNHQIEHHIFPGLSHTRYPAIRPLVRDYCREQGVDYLEYPSFWSVVTAHYQHLRDMGAPS